MAYNALNNLIDAYIYANGVQAITGQILNGVLKQMVSQLGSGYHLMGVAGPETEPASNDYAMAYFAATAGQYADFGGITLAAGEVAVLLTSGNGSWSKQTVYTVPTDTADLENTAGFITNAVTDLVNYYTKTEVDDTLANYPTLEGLATALADYYTKDEIDALPNGEDIDFNEDGKLQFANRVYNAQQPNGMGYKILRKDATFAAQVTVPNTIYEIRYDFDLNNATVTIPAGCVLKFNGGAVYGGTLTGDLLNDFVRPEWFGAGRGNDDSEAIQNCLNLSHKIIFNGEYRATGVLQIKKVCCLDSDGSYATIHYNRIECVSSESVSLNGSSFNNICFDGDMSCGGLLIKSNDINIENCSFINTKGYGYYGNLTSAIFVGDYYSGQDGIVYSNIHICNCVFDRAEPNDTTSVSEGNPTTARFILVNNGSDIKITNCVFKNLVGLKDSDCIQITGNADTVDYFPFVGSGNWSGSNPGYSGESYRYSSVFINKNVFYLTNTKSAIKIMASGVSVVDNKFFSYSDYSSPLGQVPQFSIIRANYARNIEIAGNQVVIQNAKLLESVFSLEFCYDSIVSNNTVSFDKQTGWSIESANIFAFRTNDKIICGQNLVSLEVLNNFYVGSFESNGMVLFSKNNFSVNYVGNEDVKELHYWTNHYIYPSNTKEGRIIFRDCVFDFGGTFSSIGFTSSSEKSYSFENCKMNADDKQIKFALNAVCDIDGNTSQFYLVGGKSKLYIEYGASNATPGSSSYASSNVLDIENTDTLILLVCRANTNIKESKFRDKLGNYQISLQGGFSYYLEKVEFKSGVVQLRNDNGNNSATIKDVLCPGSYVVRTYIPSGTLSLNYEKSTIVSDGLTRGATAGRTGLGSSVEIGFEYFDTDIHKPCWYKGSGVWVDATGASI